MKCELVIFDCDGVLVDTEPVVNRVFVEMIAELGLRLDLDETLREFAGCSMAQRMRTIESRCRWQAPRGFLHGFDQRLVDALRRRIEVVPGVKEALAQIRLARCVASNGSPSEIRLKLGLVDLLAEFGGHLFSAEAVSAPKPDPALFLHAARSMGVVASACVVVEDSVPGVEGAIRAGMRVLGYAGRTDKERLAAGGAEVFESMAELAGLVR